ncbi:MAG: hypothetical protein JWO30_590 [Fibrobacteres bacterium]|nr:hypothetical protein [Fibrobacterota bacterium]
MADPRFTAHWYGPIILVLAIQGLIGAGALSNPLPPVKKLPRKQLESVYRNGDLDSVVIYVKMGRPRVVFLDRSDSSLAFKYLGVIYAADSKTREKGRYYFNQLLRLDNQASITDLLPGESARSVFKEVREEFFELNPNLAQPANAAPPPVAAAPPIAAEEDSETPQALTPFPVPVAPKKQSHTWMWVTGGVVGVVAAGAGAAIFLIDPAPKNYKLHD